MLDIFLDLVSMPKEPRRRARKHKVDDVQAEDLSQGGPSWILPSQERPEIENSLDPELKAYFRSVDIKLQEWAAQDADGLQIVEGQLAGLFISFCVNLLPA